MPLNYSKWDALEISDDSDIEGHPNVDHKSLVRWKQRDIHEKREVHRRRTAQLEADIACNDVLGPRLRTIADEVAAQGPPRFSSLTEQFKASPSPDKPPTDAPGQKTYDDMLLSLMLQVWDEIKRSGMEPDDPKLGDALEAGLRKHIKQMGEHQAKLRKELEQLEEESKKKITSDDIHEGWESHYVPPQPAPPPIKGAKVDPPKNKATSAKTEFEVINPKGVDVAVDTFKEATPSAPSASLSTDDDELPELTPSLEQFSRLPLRGYEQSWEFIKNHRDVMVPGASDALLVAGFTAESNGQYRYAQQCVNQSLLIQYCEKLGGDGVRVFFRKMIDRDPRASAVFEKDVADTYKHLKERVRISKAEATAAEGSEQIQLVPEDPSQKISFNVPDGAPPENLQLEGEGLEDVNIEDVRKMLQLRWDVFDGFPPELQEALKTQELDKVNKVLGNMKVDDAEQVVKMLDIAGILNFSDGGIRDETGKEDKGKGKAVA
ncbi:Cdc37 N terminal kinase binding-domain-containing protein [Fomitopsis serialis]|uniref:Cdc37 N terminal kinase binding-domain-containing protein n=1 Tax=Fomitopsis serialis TaxID=139415 RepID=UPI002007C19B|nr:Cdc37 N terminal kinase binding-domain-containing protein [Neoantrodia serialis]KAH9936657.1 Cdc37 N terminal kinase binding-domain-containing protein [Neoantrodia serialis]